VAALAFLVGPAVGLALRLRKQAVGATIAMAITVGGFFVAAHLALVRFEPFLSSVELARAFNATAAPQDKLLIYGDQSYASSLIFYSGRQAILVNGKTTSLEWGSHYPDAPHIFWNADDLRREWSGNQRAFLFVTSEQRQKVLQILGPAPAHVVAEASGKELLTNK
jgi:hypothetical protein